VTIMKKVLVFTHVDSEGSGTLGYFLESLGFRLRTVRLHRGDRPPNKVRKFDAIISMGGPMNVDEEHRYPFLRKELNCLERAIDANIPVLGVCLGAQLIAKASGAVVTKALERELGWNNVFITDEGRKDILFQGLPQIMNVFQWHEDTFEIPRGATLLATANPCPQQAFRYGNAYGLQFHIEITENELKEWFKDQAELEDYIVKYRDIKRDYYKQAHMIYANFIWLIELCHQVQGK
jgi:GMP synthase (glutamine-hydrolysing)